MISATHIHAMIIHFPIALLMVGFIFELITFRYRKLFFTQAAFCFLVLGTLGTIASYIAGKAAGDGIEEGALGKAIELHQRAGTITLWLSIATTFFYSVLFIRKINNTKIRMVGLILFAVVLGFISKTGYLGGQLVFKHGAGVELALPDFSNPDDN